MNRRFLDSLLAYTDLVALVLCLGLVFGVWYWGVSNDTTSQKRIEVDVNLVEEKLDEYFEHMFDYTGAVRGLFEGSEKVTQEEFSRFTKAMMGDDEYPSLLRFAVFKAVKNEDIDEFEKDFAKEFSKKDYSIDVNEDYPNQYITVNIVKGNGEMVDPSGQNLRNSADRKELLAALDGGAPKFVRLADAVRNVAEYSGRSIFLNLPIYKEGKMWGFATTVVSFDWLVQEISAWQDPKTAWSWKWNGVEVATGGAVIKGGRTVTDSIEISVPGDQKLFFEFETEKDVADYWNWVLGLGVIMSFVVYTMVYALSLSGNQTKLMAEQMTVDLRKYKLALDSSSNHVVITDVDGVIIYANEAVTKLTGFPVEEILGQTPRLWGKQMPSDFYQKFWDTIKNKREVFKGEVTNKKKDGTVYIAEAVVSPIIDDAGELIGFVGIEQDVTDRKQHTMEMERTNQLMVGRELKMIELKKEIELLKNKIKK